MLIEVKGVQFVNKGAELMLHAVLQQLQQRWPHAQLVLAPNPNSPYLARAAVGALQRLPLRKGWLDLNSVGQFLPVVVRRWLQRNLGVVFAVDIDVVLDASGFAYGDQWPMANTKQLCAELRRFSKPGKAYVLLPQAFGPFSRHKEQLILSQNLPLATMICAREHTSYSYIAALIGKTKNLYQFADFTNLVNAKAVVDYEDGARKVLIIPNANMLSNRNQHSEWQHNYLPMLVDAVSVISAMGLIPVLLNHEGKDDAAICDAVQQAAAGKVDIITETDPLKVKGIIGASKAVICSRFHGCVSALSQGVPCLGTSWSHKYERLFEEYDQLDALLGAKVTKAQLAAAINAVLSITHNVELEKRRRVLKQQSELMWQTLEVTVNQRLVTI